MFAPNLSIAPPGKAMRADQLKAALSRALEQNDKFFQQDEIEARRDALIDALEKRLHRASHTRHLFTIRWEAA